MEIFVSSSENPSSGSINIYFSIFNEHTDIMMARDDKSQLSKNMNELSEHSKLSKSKDNFNFKFYSNKISY